MRKEIQIAGFGGQGIGLSGYILGKAMALYDGHNAVMTQAYGPEARGGASSANIVVSDKSIDYPFVQYLDVLVALSQEAYSKFRPAAKKEAQILIDADLVTPGEDDILFQIPATRLAEEMGKRIVANVVMVGFFTSVTRLVSKEAVEKAIETSVKSNIVSLNLEAFRKGLKYADNLDEFHLDNEESLIWSE